MAFRNATLFFTLIVLMWLTFTNGTQPEKFRVGPQRSVRPSRMVRQRAFQDFDLMAARGYGKRAPSASYPSGNYFRRQFLKSDLLKEPLLAARLYGKRDGVDSTNNDLLDWLKSEASIENDDLYSRMVRDEEILLPN